MRDIFDLKEVERRESSNCVDNEYYVATALSMVIVFARTDDGGLDDYQFWIHFRVAGTWLPDTSFIDGLADLLARRLVINETAWCGS